MKHTFLTLLLAFVVCIGAKAENPIAYVRSTDKWR